MKFAAAVAAFAGLASAGKIPLHYNPLTIADYMSQKEQIITRAYRMSAGE